MLLSFDTHDVYIIYEDNKIYKLKEDFSREKVSKVPFPSGEKRPIIVIQEYQFNCAKNFLLDKSNCLRMKDDTARVYNKLGFLTDEELERFLSN